MQDTAKILIVDDDQTVRDVLSDYLSELGYSVHVAADGLEGMDEIKKQDYDILLLDIRMPYVSGLGLLKIARKINPLIPVVCMTGYGASPEKLAAEEDVRHVLSKPFELSQLATILQEVRGQSSQS